MPKSATTACPSGEQHVLRLQVAVHDAVRVRVRQRVGELAHEAHRVGERKRALARQPRPQRLALDVRHHVVQQPVRLAGVVDAEDVRVRQAGRRSGSRAGSARRPAARATSGSSTLTATRRGVADVARQDRPWPCRRARARARRRSVPRAPSAARRAGPPPLAVPAGVVRRELREQGSGERRGRLRRGAPSHRSARSHASSSRATLLAQRGVAPHAHRGTRRARRAGDRARRRPRAESRATARLATVARRPARRPARPSRARSEDVIARAPGTATRAPSPSRARRCAA